MTDDKAGPRDTAAYDGLVDALAQVSFVVMSVLTRTAAQHDLSLTQLRVLAILSDRRLGLTDLAAYLGLEKSTMSGLVRRAEQRGIMARKRSGTDGRAVELSLTQAGHELVERGRAEITRELALFTDVLSGREQTRLRHLLDRLLTARETE